MTLEKIEEGMQEFIDMVVKQLVDKPDEVNVSALEGEQQIIFELTVGDGDFGKVIGKKGRNISALRTLLFAINAKNGGKRARLDVIDKNEKKD
ncbi:MAG: KH domain-containing protein [Candidatus Neomarinimicrobiota bacterium]